MKSHLSVALIAGLGTPFSQCVSGGAKLLRRERERTSGKEG